MGRAPRRLSKKEAAVKHQADAVTTADDDLPLSFDSPESSSIAWAKYDPGTETLIVCFTQSGLKYGYGNIKESQWREFYQAESRGAYFNKHIRPMAAGKAL